jgi:hypothetical protein
MKITLNGFEIEIMENDTQLTIAVKDAAGKELSNNTYEQEETSEEVPVQPVDMPSVQTTIDAEAQTVQPTQAQESLIPMLESIKKENSFKTIFFFKNLFSHSYFCSFC